jgi:hypothetical protein
MNSDVHTFWIKRLLYLVVAGRRGRSHVSQGDVVLARTYYFQSEFYFSGHSALLFAHDSLDSCYRMSIAFLLVRVVQEDRKTSCVTEVARLSLMRVG